MITFLDTSAVIAALDESDNHHVWSKTQIEKRKTLGPLVIIDVVYCELCYGLPSRAEADKVVTTLSLERAPTNDDALFRASVAFQEYRVKNKGQKRSALPDFFIGAFAETANAALVTANASDFRKYFPMVTLLAPD